MYTDETAESVLVAPVWHRSDNDARTTTVPAVSSETTGTVTIRDYKLT